MTLADRKILKVLKFYHNQPPDVRGYFTDVTKPGSLSDDDVFYACQVLYLEKKIEGKNCSDHQKHRFLVKYVTSEGKEYLDSVSLPKRIIRIFAGTWNLIVGILALVLDFILKNNH